MSLNNLGLGLVLSAKDMASGVLSDVDRNFRDLIGTTEEAKNNWQSAMEEWSAGARLFDMGMKGIQAGWNVAAAAAPFEQSLTDIGARLRLTDAQMVQLRENVYATSQQLRDDAPDEVAQALNILARETRDLDKALQVLGPTMEFADAAEMEGGQAAEFMRSALKAMKMETSEAGVAADKLTWMMTRFGLTGQELQGVMGPLAMGAQTAGQSFDSAMTVFGLARSVLPNTQQAVMATRMALMQLANPQIQEKVDALLGRQGSMVDAAGNMRPLEEILTEIMQRTADLTESQRQQALSMIFGRRAAGGMGAVMEALSKGMRDANGNLVHGADAIAMLRKEAKTTTGALDEYQGRREGTLQYGVKRMEAAWKSFKIQVGEAFIPIFERAISFIEGTFTKVSEWFRGVSPEVKDFVAGIFLAVSSLIAIAGAFKMVRAGFVMLKIFLPLVTKGLSIFTTAWKALNFAFAASPIGAVIVAIVGLILWIKYVYDNWEMFYEFWVSVWEGMKNAASAVWEGIVSVAEWAWGGIKSVLEAIGGAFKWLFVDVIYDGALKPFGTAMTDYVVGPIKTFFGLIYDGVMWIYDKVKAAVGWVMDIVEPVTNFLGITGQPKAQQNTTGFAAMTAFRRRVGSAEAGEPPPSPGTHPGVAASIIAPQYVDQVTQAMRAVRQQPISVTTNVNLEGEQVGRVVTTYQQREGARAFQQPQEETT